MIQRVPEAVTHSGDLSQDAKRLLQDEIVDRLRDFSATEFDAKGRSQPGPLAALGIVPLAVREGLEGWRGEDTTERPAT